MKDWSGFTLLQRVLRACPSRLVGTRGQGGFGLIETIVSLAVVGTASAALASAMSTGFLGYRIVEGDVLAGRLAIAQMEKTKASPYLAPVDVVCSPPASVGSYPAIAPPAGFGLTVEATAIVDDPATAAVNEARDLCTLERITVRVTHNGREIKKLEDYKGNR